MKTLILTRTLLFGILISLFSNLFISCSDDDDNNGENTEEKVLVPSKLIIERGTADEETYTFTYDSEWRVTSMKGTSDGESVSYTFSYNSNGQLIKRTRTWGNGSPSEKTYTYESGLVKEWDGYDYNICNVDANNLVTSYIESEDEDDKVFFEYDSKNRMAKTTRTFDDEAYTYEYDDKNGVSKNINMSVSQAVFLYEDDDFFQPFMLRVNNLTKTIGVGFDFLVKFTYEYNEDRYPTKMTIDYDYGDEDYEVSVWEFEYIEKK